MVSHSSPLGPRVAIWTCALGMGLAAATACSTQSAGGPTRTVVITRTATAPAQPSGTAAGSGGASGSATASATPTGPTQLPGTCDDLLPLAAVDNALGRSVKGQTAFVVGKPEKDIGRTGYLNCRYGLPAGAQADQATPKIEIGVSLYATSAQASARIPATVDAYVGHGATSTTAQVGDRDATVLTGGAGDFAAPTLVVAAGPRTVAVTVDGPAGPATTKDLVTLAALALDRTGS